MRGYRTVLVAVVLTIILGALPIAAQDSPDKTGGNSPRWYNPTRYNPVKLIKRGPKSANDQLGSDADLEKKLTDQLRLQGILLDGKNLQDSCSAFRDLADCVAALRLSRSLQIEFSCLKWDVTGVKPKPVADSCAGPGDLKPMPLHKAVDLLKPDCDAKAEAKNALRRAHDDIKDASS